MKELKTLFRMIRQEYYILTQEQRHASIKLFFIVSIGSIMELLGVSSILPFIQSITNMEELCQNKYIRMFISVFAIEDNTIVIFLMALFIVLVYIVKNFYLMWSLKIQYAFRYKFQKDLSVRIFDSYMRRPYQFFLNIDTARVLRAVGGDVVGVFGIYEYFFKFVSEILNIVLIGAFLFYTDWMMAIGVMLWFLICFIFVTFVFKNLLRDVGKKQREADLKVTKYIYQAIYGIKEISVMRKKAFFVCEYADAYEERNKMEKKNALYQSYPEKIIELICVIGLIGIVCIRIMIGIDLASFITSLSAFAMGGFKILPSISRLVGYINGVVYQRPALEATYNQLFEVEKWEDYKESYIEDRNSNSGNAVTEFKNQLVLEHVTWHYDNSEKVILNDISLKIKKGQTVGLIGSSGAGKTTLSDIILGLLIPQQGHVFLDNVDIFTIGNEWGKLIGYVPQTVYLTDDTLRNNVAFGEKRESIDDERVNQALERAQMSEFVKSLPEGIETIVGERGIKFSGGQRQRVAIARALYYDPEIIVLDEATSALDMETEEAVMEAIDSLYGRKTLIIIAHRLSTLRKCDVIYKIENGNAQSVDVDATVGTS